jgi:hypothetical protein
LTAKELTKQVLKELELRGVWVWRQNNIHVQGRTFNGLRGVPDIIGVNKKGKFIGIEIKAGKDRMSEFQETFKEEIEKRGAVYLVVRNLQDLEKLKEVA